MTRRRRVLAAVGAGAVAAIAGCNAVGDGTEPVYEDGDVDPVQADDRSADELATAAARAEGDPNPDVTPLGGLSIADHEFVMTDDFRGPTVQGTVENGVGDRIRHVEVRVRAYDATGDHLGRFVTSTGDLGSGSRWAFTVVLLAPPADLDAYDAAVLGTPT